MIFLRTLLQSLVSFGVLFVLTKLVGNRQMSNMSFFDYIHGMTIGSIAAEMAVGIDENLWVGVIAMTVYGLLVFFMNLIDRKSVVARRFLSGTPTLLYENGVFLKKNFAKAQLSISEFQEMCRIAGYYDISRIASAQLESNGKLSILAKSEYSTVTLSDLGSAALSPAVPPVSVVYEGKVLDRNLLQLGKNQGWLQNQLKAQRVDLHRVYLATVDGAGNLTVYPAEQ